jgi:restriction endonuclease S subunit
MNHLSAAERRFHENATLIGAQRILFSRLAEIGTPLLKLSEIAETASGGTPDRNTSSFFGGSLPWLKSGELNDGLVTDIEESITDSGLENSSAKVFPSGTLLIALYGATVGKTGVLGIAAATNQAICAVMPKRGDVRVSYLYWFLRHKREDFLQNSFGGAQPNISQRILRDTVLPLPSPEIQEAIAAFLQAVQQRMQDGSSLLPELPAPFADQRRIVARIEELAGKIQEARTLRKQAEEETEALIKGALHRLANTVKPTGELGDVLSIPPRNGWSARCDNAEDGIPVLSLGAVTGYRYKRTEFKRTSLYAPQDGHFWLKPGDVLITRSNTPELVGHAAIYDGNPTPCIYPDLMMRLEVKNSHVEHRFVWYWLQSPISREFISQNAKGTSPTMKKISQGTVMAIPFPSSLPIAEQRRIVTYLDVLQERTDSLKALQAETSAELDALLPSILDKAFRGEL